LRQKHDEAMKNNDFLKELHIGKIIKDIACHKGISSKKIAEVICRYQQNTDKIFKANDMCTEDVVRISYLLEHNILDFLAKEYLSHLPATEHFIEPATCLLRIDVKKRHITHYKTCCHREFLKKAHIGQHIRAVAKKMAWREQDMANLLQCTQSMISYWLSKKSITVKTLIRILLALQYHFMAEVYLSQMVIDFAITRFNDFILTVHTHQIHVTPSNGDDGLMVYRRIDDKN